MTAVFERIKRSQVSLSPAVMSRVALSKRDGVLLSSGAITRFISQAGSSKCVADAPLRLVGAKIKLMRVNLVFGTSTLSAVIL